MNLTLVNNHVLFALAANRRMQPDWSRSWQTEVVPAVTAAESRRGLRAQPRIQLKFLITPSNVAEQVELNECVMAAKKSGLACAPLHGRSGGLLEAANGSTSIVVNNTYEWAVGLWIFLRHRNGTVETRQLTAVNLAGEEWTLEFTDALTQNYPAKTNVQPLLFGEFACDEMAGKSPTVGPVTISITELESARNAEVGEEEAPTGDGIGTWAVEDDNIVQ